MRRFSFILAAALALAAPAPRSHTWRIIGPGGGGAQFIPTISPHDPRTVLTACDMTGAYLTRDGGRSWRMFNLRSVVATFAFDPHDPQVIYAGNAALWRSELATLRAQEAQRGDAAVDRLGELQAALTSHLATLGAALEEPMARLIETASEAPRAAAEVIGQLRQEMTGNLARDNQLLEERSRILETLNSLLAAINQASAEQRGTIATLVGSSSRLLEQAGSQLAEQVGVQAAQLSDVAAQVTSSAVEVSSLSEAFGFAVQLFSTANEKLIANLEKIESSMDRSTARSDEQLAYYVAQAREIIDLSIMSQKDVVDELRQLGAATAAGQVS